MKQNEEELIAMKRNIIRLGALCAALAFLVTGCYEGEVPRLSPGRDKRRSPTFRPRHRQQANSRQYLNNPSQPQPPRRIPDKKRKWIWQKLRPPLK